MRDLIVNNKLLEVKVEVKVEMEEIYIRCEMSFIYINVCIHI